MNPAKTHLLGDKTKHEIPLMGRIIINIIMAKHGS